MYLSGEKLGLACQLAAGLLENLTIGSSISGKYVISVEQMKDVVEAQSGWIIEKKRVPFAASHLRGRIERYINGSNKRAIIHIRDDQDEYWKRYVFAKELMHLVVDSEIDLSPYGDKRIEELISYGYFGDPSIEGLACDPTQSEVIAEIVALEVLYPLHLRSEDLEKRSKRETDINSIARKYGIPMTKAGIALSKRYLEQIESVKPSASYTE
jgi:Zn-dependent peptidase ImmA (M78 family)